MTSVPAEMPDLTTRFRELRSFAMLTGREVAAVDGLLYKLHFVISPKPANVRESVGHRVQARPRCSQTTQILRESTWKRSRSGFCIQNSLKVAA
jgi:hypothetical protein